MPQKGLAHEARIGNYESRSFYRPPRDKQFGGIYFSRGLELQVCSNASPSAFDAKPILQGNLRRELGVLSVE